MLENEEENTYLFINKKFYLYKFTNKSTFNVI